MANKATSTKKKAPVARAKSASKSTVKTAPASVKKQTVGQHVESALQSVTLWRAIAAEFLGTFLLAAAAIAGQGQPIFLLFALAGITLLFWGVSGAHVNPAITVGAWATRRIGWLRALGYLVAQFLGAAVAFFTLQAFLGGAPALTEAQQAYGQSAPSLYAAVDLSTVAGREWYVFFAELLGTTILAFAVAHALRAKDTLSAAFSAGLGIFIALMVVVTIGGYIAASGIINPAVALALQVYTPSVWPYAVYALAPVIAGVIGFVLYDLLRGKNA